MLIASLHKNKYVNTRRNNEEIFICRHDKAQIQQSKIGQFNLAKKAQFLA